MIKNCDKKFMKKNFGKKKICEKKIEKTILWKKYFCKKNWIKKNLKVVIISKKICLASNFSVKKSFSVLNNY